MTKNSCVVCTAPILNVALRQNNHHKSEARICTQHGNPGYPRTIKCITCKMLRPRGAATAVPQMEPIAMNICFYCWMAGGAGTRCCEFEID